MRTQQQIWDYYQTIKEKDFFGFRAEVLAEYMTFNTVRPLLKDGAQEKDWIVREPTDANVREDASKYAEFAWRKVADHRGISANRNIDKMETYLWLLGEEDKVDLDSIPYAQYGAPQLAAICEVLKFPVPSDESIRNMIAGNPCRPDCDEGCGQGLMVHTRS